MSKDYAEEKKEIYEFIDYYKNSEMLGLAAVQGIIEYAQYIDKIDYPTAKEILYHFVEQMLEPEE